MGGGILVCGMFSEGTPKGRARVPLSRAYRGTLWRIAGLGNLLEGLF